MCVCDGETRLLVKPMVKSKVSCQKNFYIDVISLGKKMRKCSSVALSEGTSPKFYGLGLANLLRLTINDSDSNPTSHLTEATIS